MDQNGCSGFGNWASYYTFNPSLSSSSSSCSPFSDQFVVPTLSSSGGAHHQQLLHQSHHHLTCLKLGKRQYCASAGTDQEVAFHGGSVKRERSSASLAVISRCQVDGCDRNLMGAKDYHRRHKVCDLHSKAPKVVILGSEQRFCQQCSRFHAVSEFDDLKRSCRRRLAGHNERRRKSANSTAPSDESRTAMGSGILHMSQTSPGRALSLLSSCSPWISTPDLSSRSSAALHELIAENRAALFSRCLLYNQAWQNVGSQNDQAQLISVAAHQNHETSAIQGQELTAQSIIAHGNWNQLQVSGGGNHLTLDLMQSPGSASFDFISRRNKSKEAEECCEIWNSLEGTHVV